MLEPERHRIRLCLRAQFVRETLIGERVLNPQRRPEGPREKWRSHGMSKGPHCGNRSSRTGKVGRHSIALVLQLARRRFRRARFQRLRLIAEQHPADEVSWTIIPGAI